MNSEFLIEKFREACKDRVECDHCFGKCYVYSYQGKKINNNIPVFKKCLKCEGKGFTNMTDEEIREEIQNEAQSAIEERD